MFVTKIKSVADGGSCSRLSLVGRGSSTDAGGTAEGLQQGGWQAPKPAEKEDSGPATQREDLPEGRQVERKVLDPQKPSSRARESHRAVQGHFGAKHF